MRPCGGGAHDHAQPLYTDVEQGPARPQPCRGWRGSPAHDIEAPAPALGPWGGPNGGAGAAAAVGGAATGCGPWAPRPETTWQGPLAPPSPRKPPAACCAPPAAGARPPAPPQPEPRWHGALSDAAVSPPRPAYAKMRLHAWLRPARRAVSQISVAGACGCLPEHSNIACAGMRPPPARLRRPTLNTRSKHSKPARHTPSMQPRPRPRLQPPPPRPPAACCAATLSRGCLRCW